MNSKYTINPQPVPNEFMHSHPRVPLGSLFADQISRLQAIDLIAARARSGEGGYVVTPNVDHVCVAQEDNDFRTAHRSAFLSLVDGTPLVWLAKLSGQPLPEKISGSDLIEPLCERAAKDELTVGMFGASPLASQQAHDVLKAKFPDLQIVARVTPRYSPGVRSADVQQELDAALHEVSTAKPDLLFVAMGTPNQELFLREFSDRLSPTLMCGIGAGFDFLAGNKVRAPKWAQTLGVEWLVRLAQEPRRMWRRYLVRDRAIFVLGPKQVVRMRRERR